MLKRVIVLMLIATIASSSGQIKPKDGEQKSAATEPFAKIWTIVQAKAWQDEYGWLRGCNFTPSTAINQLEMWQAETFDSETIDRELGWAEDIGMNCMRVYLHHVAWESDRDGFKDRLRQYLKIADSHGIKTMFVFFDDCWNATYKTGKQPDPKPGVHNSGWLRDPGDLIFQDESLMPLLEKYVKDIMTTFKNDRRIVIWDLYNEPGNNKLGTKSMPLLQKVFQWGWDVRPSQPLTAGIWGSQGELNKFQMESSDIISYHSYGNPERHQAKIDQLKSIGRPMICSEYMARRSNSLFSNIMPMLKAQNIGAINWGLVDGKTNTKYAWSEPIPDGSEPPLWFHEILHKDGTPYKQEEVDVIKSLTKGK